MRKTQLFCIQNKPHWQIYRLLRGRTVSEKLPKIPLFGLSLINQLRLLGSQQHPQGGVLLTSFSTWGTENSLAETNLENTGVIKDCNIFFWGGGVVKNWQTFALWADALSCNKKKTSEQKYSFRIRITTVFWMLKDSTIIRDAIRRSFLTKSAATAAMFISVRVDIRRPPLSSYSTSSLPSLNREYRLIMFDLLTASFP
jgi:hypothetical protein